MTFEELHEILDDEHRKLSKKELEQVIYELKQDCFNEVYCLDQGYHSPKTAEAYEHFYMGESNAFQICLDLIEHLEDKI